VHLRLRSGESFDDISRVPFSLMTMHKNKEYWGEDADLVFALRRFTHCL
jgi:hypothetical protein